MRKILITLFVALPLQGVFSPGLDAAKDQERALLAQLIAEIDALQPLIAAAQVQADDPRKAFDYAALRNDLHQVREGVRDYLSVPEYAPQTWALTELDPLAGTYRTCP